jgi:hypothetical protein
MLATGTRRETTENLLCLERAKVIDEAMRQLPRDKTTLRTLVSEAERIEGHGRNTLDAEANKARLSTDEHAAQFLTSLATRQGPSSDGLTDIARRLKSGDINRAAAHEFLRVVRGAMETGLDRGSNARGIEPGATDAEPLEPGDRGAALFSLRGYRGSGCGFELDARRVRQAHQLAGRDIDRAPIAPYPCHDFEGARGLGDSNRPACFAAVEGRQHEATMPGPDISDEAVEAACRAHQAALAATDPDDPETDEWGDLEPEAQDIFRGAMRTAIRAFIEAHGFV